MATSFTFKNEVVELPGSYSQFVSGVTNPPLALSYGNVLLIDTGSNAGYGAGAGIAGTLGNGADAIYQADTLGKFRKAIGGGILWDIAAKLFQPNGAGGGNGVSKLFYARAATTVAAEAVLDFTSGANGGTAVVQVKNEGVVGNGVQGDQTLASVIYTITAIGADGDIHNIGIDEGGGAEILSTFTKTAAETTVDAIAAKLVENISGGYTAVQDGDKVIVTARNPIGLEQPTDWHGYTVVYTQTGAAAATAGAYLGGVDGTTVTRGYATTIGKGEDDINAFVVRFYRGTYRGVDSNGYAWDGISEEAALSELIATSPEFKTIQELHTWMETDAKFGSSFKLKSKSVVGSGALVVGDITDNAGNFLFSGGTEVYATGRIDEILEHVQSLDYSLVLSDKYAEDAQHTDNAKLLAHITDAETFGDKIMILGGGNDSASFKKGVTNSSVETAIYYNSDRVVVCHGGPTQNNRLVADGYVTRPSLHKAASIVGRIAGLQPQIPLTFKTIRIDGERHKLSVKEKKEGLRYGVLMTAKDGISFSVVQGINTIQNNDYLINPDGTTHSIQLRRMMAQVNKELIVNSVEQLLKNPDGTNRNTLSASDVKSFTEGYLKTRTARVTEDNMIISFRNVVVTLDNDAYKVTYDVIFNTEITKMFFTGTVFLNF